MGAQAGKRGDGVLVPSTDRLLGTAVLLPPAGCGSNNAKFRVFLRRREAIPVACNGGTHAGDAESCVYACRPRVRAAGGARFPIPKIPCFYSYTFK
jgi:hypothetical protein